MTYNRQIRIDEEWEEEEGEGGEDEVWIDIHSRYDMDRIIVIDEDRQIHRYMRIEQDRWMSSPSKR